MGKLLPHDHIRRTLDSIFRYNFRQDFDKFANTRRVYALNDEAGLVRRIDCHAEDGLPQEIELEDYREVDGVRFPFLVRQFTPVYSIVMRLRSVRTNVPVDDSLFERP